MVNQKHQGFTLIEVLVALTIIGVALGAALRTVGVGITTVQNIEQRQFALLLAQNRLAEMHLQAVFPPLGRSRYACALAPASSWRFYCEQWVEATPNAQFRRVSLSVYKENRMEPDTSVPALAHLEALLQRP